MGPEVKLSLLISLLLEHQLAKTLCFSKDQERPVRLSDTSELLVFPTPTPSPSPDPRDASSREQEDVVHPEDTRSKMSHLCIFFIVIVDCIKYFKILSNNDD